MLKVGDIPPWECTRKAPKHDIRYILSYFIERFHPAPSLKVAPTIKPRGIAEGGKSCYFGWEDYGTPEIERLFNDVLDFLPDWMNDAWKNQVKDLSVKMLKKPGVIQTILDDIGMTEELLLKKIEDGADVFFAKYPISYKGDNWRGGLGPLTGC